MIALESVCRSFRKGDETIRALDGISLEIEAGEMVAILGPSGSGKSTLMHVLGLLDRPDEGRYELGGQNVATRSPDELAALRSHCVGFVFQAFHLLPRATAVENVELPLVYAGGTAMRRRALRCLEEVGLADRAHHFPSELSGGQQQRVALARALVNEPQLLLADEPTGNLDSASSAEILELLRNLHGQGRTLVLVTHDAAVARCAERQIHLVDGGIVSDTKVASVPDHDSTLAFEP